jgi:hypothetical protein
MASRDGQSTDSQNFAPLVKSKAVEDDVRTVSEGASVQVVADDRSNQRLIEGKSKAVGANVQAGK